MLVVLLGGVSMGLQAENWIADERSGCRVWNPDPQPAETIEWDGECAGDVATGFGTLIWYQNRKETERASGNFEAGRIEGDGVWRWSSGHEYQGHFHAGRFDGEGRFTWPNGSSYTGSFRNNLRHGMGHHRDPDGAEYKGPYYDGKRHGTGLCHDAGDSDWVSCRWWEGERLPDPDQA